MRLILTINAVVFALGGMTVFAPEAALASGYFAPAGDVAPWVARLNGIMFLGMAALAWFGRGVEQPEARRAVLVPLLVVNFGYGVVHLLAVLSDVGPPVMWWGGTAAFFVLAAGYARALLR